jgi:NAD(P)-dependent dehydrogenase (short-subunit alcohol dehydrogenase family)
MYVIECRKGVVSAVLSHSSMAVGQCKLPKLPAGGRSFATDLASLAEVSRLANEIAAAGPLDVLVNNAGVGFGGDRIRRELSRDGFELRFALNYLAPFLLTEKPRRSWLGPALRSST